MNSHSGVFHKFLLSSFLCFFLHFCIGQTQLPPDFSDQLVESFNRPVGIAFDEEGRGYVWERRGFVYILDEEGKKLPTPLIDISEEVSDFGDHGLLGFAIDPNFYENGFFYLLYVVDRHHLLYFGTPQYDPNETINQQATIGRITRYTADRDHNFETTLPGSRKVLLGETPSTGFPILMTSHGIGTLAFGHDGTLLASCGEGGSFQSSDAGSAPETYFQQALDDGIIREKENVGSFRALLVDNLNGKIIRIDPDAGDGIGSNPFYDPTAPRAARSRVWALGLRNPFRFVVRPETGSHFAEDGDPGVLYIGDVGSAAWEEINIAKKGGQCFGWPLFEGFDSKWQFRNTFRANLDAANPLYDPSFCNREFFFFQDLFINPTNKNEEIVFENPCDSSLLIPQNIPTLIHSTPAVAYSNVLWNQPSRAITQVVAEDGSFSTIQLDDPASPITGPAFDGFSSIPGLFYTEGNFPEKYKDALFSSDFSGWIKAFHLNDENDIVEVEDFFQGETGIVDLALNKRDGCIYYIHFNNHQLRKICFGGSPPPIPVATADVYFGPSPLEVHFDASASNHPFGYPLSFEWDFGDDASSTEMQPIHTFTAPSGQPFSFNVSLTVTDTFGTSKTTDLLISVNNTPPQVEIISFKDHDFYPLTDVTFLKLEADVRDAEHSQEDLRYEWQVFLQHNTHFHTSPIDNQPVTFAILEPAGCGNELFWYRIRLTVTDKDGLQGFDEKEIFPYCGTPFFEIPELTATASEKDITLSWQTNFEDNLEKFEIQRSADFKFETIGEVSATGTSSAAKNYNFTDPQPIFGQHNFYRIKAVNKDGVYDYSNKVELIFPPRPAIYIFPNPAQNNFQVAIKEAFANKIDFELYATLGLQVLKTTWDANVGEYFEHSVLVVNLSNGVYYYVVKNGKEERKGSVLIAR